jgi:hypothetical protein
MDPRQVAIQYFNTWIRRLAPVSTSSPFRLKTDRFILNAGAGMGRAWTSRQAQEHQQ